LTATPAAVSLANSFFNPAEIIGPGIEALNLVAPSVARRKHEDLRPHAARPQLAAELQAAGWQLERVLCDNGNEFRNESFTGTIASLGARLTHIRSGRPQTNGNVEAQAVIVVPAATMPAIAEAMSSSITRAAATSVKMRITPGSHRAGRGIRAVPASLVPRPEAVLARRARRDDPDARGDDLDAGRGASRSRACHRRHR